MKRSGDLKERLFNKYFFTVALVNLGISTMMQMFNSTIALHLDGLKYPASISGTMISIGAVAATIYRFFGGKLCEKRGRRRLIIIGVIDFCITSLIMGAVDVLFWLYVLRILQMFGYSMVSTAVSVAVIDVIPRQRVGEGLGYFSLASSVSQAFGPSAALVLFHMSHGFFSVMAGAAVMGTAALVVTVIFLDYEKVDRRARLPKAPPERSGEAVPVPAAERGLWKFVEKKALPPAIINFFIIFADCLITMYLTLYAAKSGIPDAGLFFTVSVVFMVGARIASGNLSDRFGALPVVVPGVAVIIAGFGLLALSARFHGLYYIAGAFYGLGNGMASPALNAEAVRGVKPHRVSVASSTFYLPLDIAFVAGALVWGVLIDRMPFTMVFFAAALVAAVALVLTLVVYSPARREEIIQ